MFSIFRSKPAEYFTASEKETILSAVRNAERRTSGEVRIYIESKCRFVDPLDRAAEVFFGLKMDLTEKRNGVLLYIAMRDHQMAIFADDGIHREMGQEYWNVEVRKMVQSFRAGSMTEGIVLVVGDIGEALNKHFPYDAQTDKNELPDDIVFGQ